MATLLSVMGLYGVIAYTVARRTREIGIRMALGALGSQIARGVLREAGALVVAGLGLGFGAAWWLGRYVQSQLYGVTPADAATIALAAAALASVGVVAALVPARRPRACRRCPRCERTNLEFLGEPAMAQLTADLRYAVRSLRKVPLFTAIAVLSMAFGIAANTAVFTLVDQVVLRTLPVARPGELVQVSARGHRELRRRLGPHRAVVRDVSRSGTTTRSLPACSAGCKAA